MKDLLARFEIYDSSGNRYTDELCDFTRDTKSLNLSNTDYLYIGFKSRFFSFYLYAQAYNLNSSVISIEYYDGTDWVDLEDRNISDDTIGFSRTGFVAWMLDDTGDWKQNEVQGNTLYWIRVSVDVSTSALTITAINSLFADDNELIAEYPPLARSDFKLGEPDYIKKHVQVRDEIVQHFRNRGMLKKDEDEVNRYLRIVAQDLLDFQEVRLAARQLAIAKILWDASDAPDDSWAVKAMAAHTKFEKYLDLAFISFDPLGGGDKNENTTRYIKTGTLFR